MASSAGYEMQLAEKDARLEAANATIARLQAERDALAKDVEFYRETNDALGRERDEARGIRDHYVRQYALSKDVLEEANEKITLAGASAARMREALESCLNLSDRPAITQLCERALADPAPLEWLRQHDAALLAPYRAFAEFVSRPEAFEDFAEVRRWAKSMMAHADRTAGRAGTEGQP